MSATTDRRTRTTQQLLDELVQPESPKVTDYTVFGSMHAEGGDYGLGLAGSFATYEEAADKAAELQERGTTRPGVTYMAVKRVWQNGLIVSLTPTP